MRSLVITSVLVAGTLAWAEEPERSGPPLALGSLVRVRAGGASEPRQGIVVAIDEHALKLATSDASWTVPVDSITAAEARVGRRRQALKGLLIGAGLGALLSQVWDIDPSLCQGDSRYFCSRGEAVVTGVLGFGAIGAGTGALIKKDRWAPIDVRAGIERALAAPPPASHPAAPPSQPDPPRPGPGSLGASCSGLVAPQRVRVVASGFEKPILGNLVGSDATTLEVIHSFQTLRLPRESVTRIERSTRRGRRVLGLKIGGGIGLAVGAGLGIALLEAESDPGDGVCTGCGIVVGILGLAGAIPGAIVGGTVAPGERWQVEDPSKVCVERRAAEHPKDPRRVRVGIASAPGGGVGFRLSVAF